MNTQPSNPAINGTNAPAAANEPTPEPKRYNPQHEVPAGKSAAEFIRMRRSQANCMHCGFEPPAEECLEFDNDLHMEIRRDALLRAVDARRGTEALTTPERFSSGFIIEQAAERYFMLFEIEKRRLKGKFSKDEFRVILNSNCTNVWWWAPGASLAGLVADDNGIPQLEHAKEDRLMYRLLKKLLALTPIETTALVDACEQVWRGYDNPLL